MSFIRQTQGGQYVNIPEGSNYYIYDDGNTIGGWTHSEFAALIAGVVDEISWRDEEERASVKAQFEKYFNGYDPDYDGGVAPPERGEIFCQCVDSRISSLTLSDELQEAVQAWAAENDGVTECEYCGEEYRPYVDPSDENICNDETCRLQSRAEMHDISFEEMKRIDAISDFDQYWRELCAVSSHPEFVLEEDDG